HLGRVDPVVRRPGVYFLLRADERAALDAGDVRRVGAGGVAARAQLGVERGERAQLDQQAGELLPFLLRAVAPVNPARPGQRGNLADPADEAAVCGRGLVKPWNGVAHLFSFRLPALANPAAARGRDPAPPASAAGARRRRSYTAGHARL